MPVIYLDVLIVLNWVIDYLLLSLTARLLRLPKRRGRLVAAAGVGGVCACQIFLNLPALLSLLLNVVVAALLIRVAFPWYTATAFIRRTFVLFCVSALFSGLVTALWFTTQSDAVITRNGVVYCDISPLMLTALALVSYAVVWLYDRFTGNRSPAALEYTVVIDDGCGTCECVALYDTGLHLREPFSGMPVIPVKREALLPYLPLPLSQALNREEGVTTTRAPARLRRIPYRTVGGEGLLHAFVPAKVILRARGEPPRDITGVYVALADEPHRGVYTALVGSEVLSL